MEQLEKNEIMKKSDKGQTKSKKENDNNNSNCQGCSIFVFVRLKNVQFFLNMIDNQ